MYLPRIEAELESAIQLVNNYPRENVTEKERDKWCEILTQHLITLDSMSFPQRKEMIVAIQNVLEQLDSLFENNKTIMLTLTSSRTSYYPEEKDSYTALGEAYRH